MCLWHKPHILCMIAMLHQAYTVVVCCQVVFCPVSLHSGFHFQLGQKYQIRFVVRKCHLKLLINVRNIFGFCHLACHAEYCALYGFIAFAKRL